MYCSRCGSPNPEGPEVHFCHRCGARLYSADPAAELGIVHSAGAAAVVVVSPSARAAVRYSKAQPIWLFVLLMLASFNLYWPYWFYRNWRIIRDHGGQDVSPFWRTVCLILPVASLVMIHSQASHVRAMAERAGREVRICPVLVVLAVIVVNVLTLLPGDWFFLSFLIAIPLALVQHALNEYWEGAHPELPLRTSPSAGQVVLIVLGALLWLLVVLGSLQPESPQGLTSF